MALAAILIASAAPTHEEDGASALWPWRDDATLVEYHIEQLAAVDVRDIEVVVGFDAEQIIPVIAGGNAEPIVDSRWASGSASSFRAGASAVPRGTDTALVIDIAEPRPAPILARLIDAHFDGGALITRPGWNGQPGAPLIVAESVLEELRNLADGGGMASIVARHANQVLDVAFDSPIVTHRCATRSGWDELQASFARDA